MNFRGSILPFLLVIGRKSKKEIAYAFGNIYVMSDLFSSHEGNFRMKYIMYRAPSKQNRSLFCMDWCFKCSINTKTKKNVESSYIVM